jgi:ABC-type nitrate/sulfonate/bicarbonate transport system permease component
VAVTVDPQPARPVRGRHVRALKPRRGWLTSDFTARLLSRLVALGVWQLVGMTVDRIPTPWQVVVFIDDEAKAGDLWNNLFITLERAATGLVFVLIVGTSVGIAMGRWKRVRWTLSDLVMVGIALPAFIWALLAVMWWGFSNVGPIFTCFVSATPMLIINTREGAMAIDDQLTKMSRAYHVPHRKQLRSLVLPSMMEYIVAGFRIAVLAGWGAVLLVEWFGNNQGAGYQARRWYEAGNFTGMMAWGVLMLVVIVAIDRLVLERILRRASQWRAGIQYLGS